MGKQYFIHYQYQAKAGGWKGKGRVIANLNHGVRHNEDLEVIEKKLAKRLKEEDPDLQGNVDVAVLNIIPLPIK